MAHRKPTSTSAKILYRPVGLASGILSGALSGVHPVGMAGPASGPTLNAREP